MSDSDGNSVQLLTIVDRAEIQIGQCLKTDPKTTKANRRAPCVFHSVLVLEFAFVPVKTNILTYKVADLI